MSSHTNLERPVELPAEPSVLSRLPQLTSRLGALARRWLRYRIVNGADADDLVQDVFLSAIQAEESYQGQTDGELEGWLATILRHRAINLLQREERFQHLRERLVQTRTETRYHGGPAEELSEFVASVIERLADADREIILLRFLGELDWNTLGDRLGLTPDAARKRVSRALIRLHTLFGVEGNEAEAL